MVKEYILDPVENNLPARLVSTSRVDDSPEAPQPDPFKDLMHLLHPPVDPDMVSEQVLRRIAQVNQQALSDQRLTQDDLQVIEQELGRREAQLQSRFHALRQGATEAARGALGFGPLSAVFGMSLAESSKVRLQSEPPAVVQQQATRTQPPPESRASADLDAPVDAPVGAGARGTTPNAPQVHSTHMQVMTATTQAPVASTAVPATPTLRPALAASSVPLEALRLDAAASKTSVETTSGSRQIQQDALGLRDTKAQASRSEKPVTPKTEEQLPVRQGRKIVDNLVRVLRANLGKRQSVVKLQLSPPDLGRLRIDMRISGDRLRIDIEAQTQQVRQLLESSARVLHDALREQGVLIERFNVSLHAPSSNDTPNPDDGGHFGDQVHDHSRSSRQHDGAEQMPLSADEPVIESDDHSAGSIDPLRKGLNIIA